MSAEVEQALSLFLEALPYQVKTWDAAVIERLARQPQIFAEFRAGDEITRWGIYIALRKAAIPQA